MSMLPPPKGAIPAYGWRTHGAGFAMIAGALLLFGLGLWRLDIQPARIWAGMGRLGDIVGLMLPPSPETWDRFLLYLGALGQTVAIAVLGTSVAALLALPLGFLAARNIVANAVVHFLARRLLDTVRSVDTLIWALIWINVVGLGPFAGALAIASADVCALAKLFSETIETADRRPVEGVLAAGGGRAAAVRFGVVPQVLPVFASQILYFIEANTRSATIIGIVGAGGIGLHLSEMIRVLEWSQASFIILLVLVAVAVMDALSRRIRRGMLGVR